MVTRQIPAVIVVNSHVARGAVGGRASVFALERMGFPVWSVPTVLLPWHLGHGKATRVTSTPRDFAALLADLGRASWLDEVGAILVGYIGDAGQIDGIASLVEQVKRRNPGALFLCDPIIGDSDSLFQPEPVAAGIRDRLVPMADITTPNRHELAWLTGRRFDDNDGLVAAARGLGVKEVVVTSAFAPASEIGALVVEPGGTHLATHRVLASVPHGTGDLFAALYLGHSLDGASPPVALERATAAVLRIVELAAELDADELPLAAGQEAFVADPRGVTVVRVDGAKG